MSTPEPLPDAIAVTESPAGRCYQLPRRRTPALRVQSIFLGLLGLLCGAIGVGFLASDLPFGLMLTVFAAAVLAFGLVLWSSRSTAELAPGLLTLTEWIGPFPVRRVRPVSHLRRFVVHRMHEGRWSDAAHNGVVKVVCEGSQDLWFAAGYAPDLLTSLAAHLAAGCGVPVAEAPADGPRVKIEPLFLSTVRDEDTFDRPDPPPGCRVAVEQRPDGLTVLRVPPDGARLPKLGCLMPVALFGFTVGNALLPGPLALVVPAGLLGLVAAAAVHTSRRWTVLAVSGEDLSVLETGGLRGPRERHWPREQIAAVRISPVDPRRKGDPVHELGVFLSGGKRVGLFVGRDGNELAWLATVLRRALQVPAVAAELVAR